MIFTPGESKDSLWQAKLGRRGFIASVAALVGRLGLGPAAELARAEERIVGASSAAQPTGFNPATSLWYTGPARSWLEAMPLGNGRLGAMPFGGVGRDQIVLNEDTLYAEEPGGRTLPLDIAPKFDEVLSLLRAGEYNKADDIATRNWLGRSWPCFQPFGNLYIEGTEGDAREYFRYMDLGEAVHRTNYVQNGVHNVREMFVSAPDDVMICRFEASSPALNLRIRFDSQHPNAQQRATGPHEIAIAGQLPGIALRRTLESVEQNRETWKYPEIWNSDGSRKPFAKQILYDGEVDGRGMRFEGRLRVLHTDGEVRTTSAGLAVSGASEVVLALALASSFNGHNKSPSREGTDPAVKNLATLGRLHNRSYLDLRRRHVADHSSLFNRVALKLDEPAQHAFLPTDQRVASLSANDDPAFSALMFQFGRYLLIACSRPGSQPANLQGIWNVDRLPPWACAYTVNINIQMNYWGAETANLSECHKPFLDFVEEMSESGSSVARDMYHRPGWVMHHNTTIWRDAQPVDWVAHVSFWPMAGGWLCQHLWEHYQFNGNDAFLRQAYPIMRGAAEFYDSWLVEDENGHLLTPISDSPENAFYYIDGSGQQVMGGLAMGCTMDMAIIRELFRNVLWAAEHLHTDDALQQRLRHRSEKLLPYRIGGRGQLLEWFKEFKEVPPRHNTSPYYPLYPGDQITLRGTPELAAAEATLLRERARTGGGFPSAWMAGCWARLAQAETGQAYLERLYATGLHPNLLNGRGDVFQIDANLGAMASTIEFLLQSHANEIELLPALPLAWRTGSVRGLRARGGFEIAIEWKEGQLTSASITSLQGTKCVVRYAGCSVQLDLKRDEIRKVNASLWTKAES
jgi:alpha-L-fucosidase 2